eukprot:scaffold33741_cov63-Phaeocystis_antarctica.AAC.6
MLSRRLNSRIPGKAWPIAVRKVITEKEEKSQSSRMTKLINVVRSYKNGSDHSEECMIHCGWQGSATSALGHPRRKARRVHPA